MRSRFKIGEWSIIIKGPGLRNDLDVRRVWRCPACGQTQRLTQDITSAHCRCVRDGVSMKLVEEPRSPRIALRAEVRSIIDRLLAGEEIPRLVSAIGGDHSGGELVGEGGGDRRPLRKPQRQESPRPERPQDQQAPTLPCDLPAASDIPQPEIVATSSDPLVVASPPVVPSAGESDDFAAGLS